MNNIYIRFKDIPKNEISGVYDGDLGRIRDEVGVSCYSCVKDEDIYKIILPSLSPGTLHDLIGLLDDCMPIYLIEADEVGTGSCGEPVVKNIKIINEMIVKQLQNPPPKYKMDKTNLQFIIKNE